MDSEEDDEACSPALSARGKKRDKKRRAEGSEVEDESGDPVVVSSGKKKGRRRRMVLGDDED